MHNEGGGVSICHRVSAWYPLPAGPYYYNDRCGGLMQHPNKDLSPHEEISWIELLTTIGLGAA